MKKPGTLFLKRDNLKLGLALGALAPLLIFTAIYYYRFSAYPFRDFVPLFFREKQLVTFFGAWCLVGNIALFTVYINSGRDKTATGIFAVTFLYGIAILLIKALG